MGQKQVTLDIACITSAGGRAVNQDCSGYSEVDGAYCLIVADGVGGYKRGEYASKLAVDSVKGSFQTNPGADEKAVRLYMETAARHISDVISKTPGVESMKTTLSVVCLDGQQITVGHIGDSRIYIFHGGKVFYMSRDHSVVMRMVRHGELGVEEIRGHPKRNILTSAIGKNPPKESDVVTFDISLDPMDGVLICSDGFWELITEDEMLAHLTGCSNAGHWLRRMEQLVGNRQSGRSDNYTCLAAKIKTVMEEDSMRI